MVSSSSLISSECKNICLYLPSSSLSSSAASEWGRGRPVLLEGGMPPSLCFSLPLSLRARAHSQKYRLSLNFPVTYCLSFPFSSSISLSLSLPPCATHYDLTPPPLPPSTPPSSQRKQAGREGGRKGGRNTSSSHHLHLTRQRSSCCPQMPQCSHGSC